MVEVVELTDNALLSRICKRLRKSAVSILGGFLLAEFSQLTLFPNGRIMKNAFVLQTDSIGCGAMSYSDLLKAGVGGTELRSYLVDGEVVPVTMRIPSNLRDSAKEAAALRGTSFSAFVRSCMIDELAKGDHR